MSVTLQEVARKAKVSKSAVSAVLAGSLSRSGTRVGALTRARIKAAAEELRYQPNMLATGLAGGRTQTVGLLWTLIGPHLSETMANNIATRAHAHGYITQLADHLCDPAITLRQLEDFSRRRVDAVIVQDVNGALNTPEILAVLRQFPAALIVSSVSWDAPFDLIEQNGLPGCRQVADHFAATGRRRPGILTSLGANDAKSRAFLERAAENGAEVADESLIPMRRRPDESLPDAYWRALYERFGETRPFPFDALFCSTDDGAVVAIDWLGKRGLSAPDDVAIVGFNNSPIGRHLNPPLASVERHDPQTARLIEQMIFSRLENPNLPPQRQSIATQFVWRASAGGNTFFRRTRNENV